MREVKAVELTEEDIEAIVGDALYKKISSNKNYRSTLDPGATKYKIASIEDEGDKYVVYGNGYFHDKYGKLTCYQAAKRQPHWRRPH